MPLTIKELEEGIRYWRGTKWPPDFHNAFYEDEWAAVQRHPLFNEAWWDRFVRILTSLGGAPRALADARS